MSEYKQRVIRKALRFSGYVQGVGFRYRAQYAARAFGVTGWVRNEPDGSVAMEAQGTEDSIDRMIGAIGQGAFIRVDTLEAHTLPADPRESGFEIR